MWDVCLANEVRYGRSLLSTVRVLDYGAKDIRKDADASSVFSQAKRLLDKKNPSIFCPGIACMQSENPASGIRRTAISQDRPCLKIMQICLANYL